MLVEIFAVIELFDLRWNAVLGLIDIEGDFVEKLTFMYKMMTQLLTEFFNCKMFDLFDLRGNVGLSELTRREIMLKKINISFIT